MEASKEESSPRRRQWRVAVVECSRKEETRWDFYGRLGLGEAVRESR
jgi:hypothetical protein